MCLLHHYLLYTLSSSLPPPLSAGIIGGHHHTKPSIFWPNIIYFSDHLINIFCYENQKKIFGGLEYDNFICNKVSLRFICCDFCFRCVLGRTTIYYSFLSMRLKVRCKKQGWKEESQINWVMGTWTAVAWDNSTRALNSEEESPFRCCTTHL